MTPVLVLVGLPASGKTTAGRRLALHLNLPFADTDAVVEREAGKTIAQIFRDSGEPEFRALEQQVVRDCMNDFTGVLALGGGAVLSADTRRLLRACPSPIVYLTTTPALALRYVRGGRGRPLLQGDPAGRLADLDAQRGPLYDDVATARVASGGRPLRYVVEDLLALATSSGVPT